MVGKNKKSLVGSLRKKRKERIDEEMKKKKGRRRKERIFICLILIGSLIEKKKYIYNFLIGSREEKDRKKFIQFFYIFGGIR